MRINPCVSLFSAIIVTVIAGGCAAETEGAPSANQSSPGASASNVPQVENPLNAEPFLDRPCDLVDRAVLSGIGDFKAGKPDVNSEAAKKLIGPSCNWHSRGSGLDVGLAISTVHRDTGTGGIEGVYAGKEAGLIDRLKPVEIPGNSGYPAAFAGDNYDFERGRCPLTVGITNELAFTASVTSEGNPKEACSAALKVAASVLDTLKEGS